MAPWTIYSHSKDRLYSSKKTIHIAGPENDVETTAKFQHLAPSRSAFWFTHRPPSMTGRFWSFLSSSSINDHLVLIRHVKPVNFEPWPSTLDLALILYLLNDHFCRRRKAENDLFNEDLIFLTLILVHFMFIWVLTFVKNREQPHDTIFS